MAKNNKRVANRPRVHLWVAVVLLFCLPPVIFVVLLTLRLTGVIHPTPGNILPVLFFAGYSIIEIGFLPGVIATIRKRETSRPEQSLRMWLLLVAGLLVWSSMPVALLLDGQGFLELFREPLTTRAREYRFSPFWLAFITWSLTTAGIYGLGRHLKKCRQESRQEIDD
ncbi:MAG: hypothetical protein ACTHW1_05205 [Ancrocorticia sp.]|uniref:hypothetical protein n=1 Tax=Ancrocorticia sp. TaxID=2593684 RepID=UPI003F8E9D16